MTERYFPKGTVEFPAELVEAVRESVCDIEEDSNLRAFRNSRFFLELVEPWSTQSTRAHDEGDDCDGEAEFPLARPTWPPKVPPLASGAVTQLEAEATAVIRVAQQRSRETCALVPAQEACYDLA